MEFSLTTPEELQQALDRLVDGELSLADEQVLLLRLDALPDGWRACALSFLEQRAWQSGCRQLLKTGLVAAAANENAVPAREVSPAPVRVRGTKLVHRAQLADAGRRGERRVCVRGSGARYLPHQPVTFPGAIRAAANNPATGSLAANHNSAAAPSDLNVQMNGYDPSLPTPERLQVSLVDSTGQTPVQTTEVPLIDMKEWDPKLFAEWQQQAQNSTPLTEEMIKELQAQGTIVEQQTYFYPTRLPNGRAAIVPIQQIRFQKQSGMLQ